MSVLKKAFNVSSYSYNGRFNLAFCGAVLDIMKSSQHLYKREDVVALYRFMANVIESGDFSWNGKFDLLFDKKFAIIEPSELEEVVETPEEVPEEIPSEDAATSEEGSASEDTEEKEPEEEPIASEGSDTTPTQPEGEPAKPAVKKGASKK